MTVISVVLGVRVRRGRLVVAVVVSRLLVTSVVVVVVIVVVVIRVGAVGASALVVDVMVAGGVDNVVSVVETVDVAASGVESVVNGFDADVEETEPSLQLALFASSHGGFDAL